MAARSTMQMVDDLDPSLPADETMMLTIDGRTYEIDLSKQNAAGLRELLRPYLEAARTVNHRRVIRKSAVRDTA